MSEIVWDPKSWQTGADSFDQAASGASGVLGSTVSGTTDPAACGAGSGYATVDGAVSIMLTVFNQIMMDNVVTSLRDGLASESGAMEATAKSVRETEQANTERARAIGDQL